MRIKYQELAEQVSKDIVGVSVSQGSKGKVLYVGASDFPSVPQGAKVRLKAVSFSKLVTGDFVLVKLDEKISVRRFVRLDISSKSTGLVLVNGDNQSETVIFTRLLGRVDRVRRGEKNINPNPNGFLQRALFKLKQRFG